MRQTLVKTLKFFPLSLVIEPLNALLLLLNHHFTPLNFQVERV